MRMQQGLFSYNKSKECLNDVVAKHNDKYSEYKNEKDHLMQEKITLYRLTLKNDFLGYKNQEYKKKIKNMGITPLSIYPDTKGLQQELLTGLQSFSDIESLPEKNDSRIK